MSLIKTLLIAVVLSISIALVGYQQTQARQQQVPDKDCAFNPNGLAKCKPDPTTSKCPSGFSANDKGNCFPKGPCPTGYTRPDNDESGQCFKK
ncbi:MAG TPA: hypothetical protein VH500_11110 [Nitrososphaeraceae archaeon]|jgi:hypothetical protein